MKDSEKRKTWHCRNLEMRSFESMLKEEAAEKRDQTKQKEIQERNMGRTERRINAAQEKLKLKKIIKIENTMKNCAASLLKCLRGSEKTFYSDGMWNLDVKWIVYVLKVRPACSLAFSFLNTIY